MTADGATPLTVVDEEGRAFIHHVCKKGDEDLTLRLLKAGADPTVQDSQGNTPLHYACEGGHIKCLNHLLDFCQNPAKCLNIMNNHGISTLHMNILAVNQRILHLACQRKDICVVKKFLEAGANANLTDGFGFTPLMRVLIGKAVYGNNVLDQFYEDIYESVPGSESSGMIQPSNPQGTELIVSCIEHLISSGASLEVQDSFGRSALHIACIFGHSALLHLLAPSGDFHHMLTKDNSGCTPLYYLYNLGHCECSRNILAQFPTSLQNTPNGTAPTHLTAVDEEGQTLLHYACRKGYISLTTELLEADADPTVQDNQGNTPLHYVCERGSIHSLKHFISKCLYSHTLWQIPNNKGVTPLSVRVSSGQTVLHLACQVCDGDLMRELFQAGGDPKIQDNQGCTPLHFACERGDLGLLSSFLDCCDNVSVLFLVQNNKGANPMFINVKTTKGDQTILHLACQKNDIRVMKGLLEAGANANLTDGFGFTPLMRVLIGKTVNCSDVLKHLPNLEDLYVNTCQLPGSESSGMIQPSNPQGTELIVSCIEHLISSGASLEVQDSFGRSALHIACIFGHSTLLHLLAPSGYFHHMLTKDNSGCTPLYYLYNFGHCECSRNILTDFPTSLQNTPNGATPTHLTAVDEEGQTLLHYACRKGYISLTTELLEAGADPTVQDNQGNTPLHYVCERGSIHSLKHFISKCLYSHTLWQIPNNKGVTPLSVRVSSGQTVLHLACQVCDGDLMRELFQAGGDPKIQDNQGCTPLHFACERGDLGLLSSFLDCCDNVSVLFLIQNNKGANPMFINVKTTKGDQTILHLACQKNDIRVMKGLLEAGANANLTDGFGFTPLMRVLIGKTVNCSDVLKHLPNLEDLYVNTCQLPGSESSGMIQPSNPQGTELIVSCIEHLISSGASLEVQDSFGRSALHIACIFGHSTLLHLLAPSGYFHHMLTKDNSGCTPLYYLYNFGHCECSRNILTDFPTSLQNTPNGATPTHLTAVDEEGQTLLHYACRKGYISLTTELLEAGADPTVQDNQGNTPLHYVCERGSIHSLKHFISKCLYSHTLWQIPNNKGVTPLSVRVSSGQTVLHLACQVCDGDLMRELFQAGGDPKIQDNQGCTPLHFACERGDLGLLSSFLDCCDNVSVLFLIQNNKGANPMFINVKTTKGDQTILHLACQKNDIRVMKGLLEAGANANLTDGFGFTPLMRVLIGKTVNCSDVLKHLPNLEDLYVNTCQLPGSESSGMIQPSNPQETELIVSCIEHLISSGASLEVQDAFGRSALHIACIFGHSTLLHLLAPSGYFHHMLTKDNSGCTPLYYLYNFGHCECFRKILAEFPTSLQTAPTDTAPTYLTAVDEEGRTLLHYACRKGYISLTTELLEAGADPTVQDNQGNTPLHYVCERGDILCSKYFIDKCSYTLWKIPNNKGVTPRYVRNSSSGQTVLHLACQMCDGNLIIKLFEVGADPRIQDNQGYTPLHYACARGDIYCLNNFFLCCQDPNTLFQIPNSSGVTPLSVQVVETGRTLLHLACEKQNSNLVRKFLKAGADPNIYDTSGFTPLMRVITKNSIIDYDANDIVIILCEFNCDIILTLRKHLPSKNITESSTQIWEGTALHMAAKVGSKPLCVQTLIAQCTTAVDAKDAHGRIPLHIAILYSHHELINFLAPHPKYFLVKDDSGCTPLYYACKDGNYQCIHGIHQQIADDAILQQCIQVPNNDGITPLTVKDANGRTILHLALLEGDGNLACKLLRAGADPTVKDHAGITPFKYKSGTINMKNRTLLHHLCCEDGNFDLIMDLLQAGADSIAQDGKGYTPLMLALRYINDTDAFRILAFCDSQHELSDCVYSTVLPHSALHIATEYNKAECVKFLLAKGADLLAKNSNGKNPLHIACMKGHNNSVVHLLTDKSIEVKDITGSTPLHYACKYGHIECVRKIISGMENDHLKLLFQMTDLEGVTPLSGTNNQGETILHHTCAAHDLSLLQDLLRYGACPNTQDNAGLTPLMTALKFKQSIDSEKILQLAKTLVSSVSWDPHIKESQRGWTVLHYAAGYEDARIAYTLLVAGCDASVEDNDGQTFSDLMPRKSLQALSKELLRIDRRLIVCVIGYPKSGKTTLIAAYKQVPRGTLQRVSTFFQTNRIILTDTRTAGIETTTLLDDKLGNIIFFDFAGQSEYYASHLAFLESALAPKGAAITFIMVVDLRLAEDEKFRQCMEWLFPVKSIVKEHNILNVVLIGSHQDQLKSGTSTAAKQSLYTIMQKLKTTLSTPCLQFIDCWGMDCRHLLSKGMVRLQECIKSKHSSYNSDEDRHAPIGASLLFHKLKNSDNPPLAITPCMIIDRLKDGHHPFPLTVAYIDRCCQDLSAAGIVLYFLDREDVSKSWLILEIEEILGSIHGKLFAPDHTDFPMHHKNLANQFGLVQTDELKVAFKHSPLDPDMVQRLLISMEFCHPIDSSLMKEGTNSTHIDKGVVKGQLGFFLNEAEFGKNWLFFPSLVKVDRSITMSTECDVSPEGCHWVCWELSTVTPHFLTPRFQQAIFIQLACNYVQKHKSVLSSVEEHSCTVSKNAMSWSTIHGVDVCVQIKYKSTVNVTARSRPGVKVSSLMELIANVVSDILTVRANHSPGVDVFSVLRVMDKKIPTDFTVPISSLIASVEENGSHVNCREQPLKLISLKDLFLDWEVSTTLLKKMHMSAKPSDLKMDFSTIYAENESTDDVYQSGSFKGTIIIQ